MKNLRQLLQRAGWVRSKQRSRQRIKQERRQLITQTLEKRELLAGDFGNPYHNYWHALDATEDRRISSRDALVIVNHLAQQQAVGEDVVGSEFKLDTNNDGHITSADALVVINGLSQGEEVGELVELLVTARDLNDVNLNPTTVVSVDPITGQVEETYDPTVPIDVNVGERFKLEIAYNDLRTFGGDIGAFQVFSDLIAGTGSGVIEGASNASPPLITSTAHGLNTGDRVFIEGATGNGEIGRDPLNLNGSHVVTVISPNTFLLNGVDATNTESYDTLSAARWTRTPGNLKPVLNETQRLVFDEGIRTATTGSYLFSLEGSAATYTSPLADFGGDPTQEVRNALTAFGYTTDQYNLKKLETGDQNIRFEIRYTDPTFGNIDLPDISVTDLFDVSAPVTLTEFSPFLADGVTPNSDAVRFNLDTRSRTYDVDVEHPQGADFYDSLTAGAYDRFFGFDEVGGVGGIPNQGGGIPELAEDDNFFEPFDVLSLMVFFDAASSLPVDVSVNPGEGDEALLLYGDNDPVPQDLILIDEDATVRFNVSDGVVDRFDPVKAAINYQATVAEDFPDDLVVSRAAPERVISTIFATDNDPTDTVSYTITGGNASGLFEINNSTGAVSLAAGRNLDAETATSHVLTVTANESNGSGTDTATITLTVTDVDEFDPQFTANDYPATVADDIADDVVITTVLATEADLTGVVSYAITGGNTSGLFEINSSTGAVSLAAGQSLTSPALHVLTVTASESDGPGTDTATVTITVTGDAPVDDFDPVFDQDDFTATVPEDISDTFVIVAATAVDADGAPVSYSITGGNASGLFEICGGCGAVSLAPGRTLDAETTISHVLTVTASESDGPGTDTATVTITVTDVNEFGVGPVTDANGNANTISEDASAGTSAQITAFATDDDLTNNTINYSLASGVLDNDLFQIDSVSGVVTLSGALDAETNSNLTIEVTASSSDGSSNTGQFDITVTDVNEFPLGSVTDSNTAANTIAENATAGTLAQITASATDPDISDTVAYSLATGVLDNDLFVINPTSGEVRLKTSGTLSGLANTSLTIEVTATSSDTSSNSAQFPIMVTEVDDFDVGPVTDIDDAANTISEDAGTGATVGITAFATDDDVSNNTITYSLAAGTEDNDLFVIDSSTGVVTLKTGGSLDAETATSLTVEITASSSDGSSSTAQFDIAVTDINEFPVGPVTDSDGTANTIAENAAAGTPARITASATDADATNNTITYSLATGVLDNDLFVIDSSTGVVTLKTTRSLDGLAGTSLTIEVTATSSDTSSNSAQFTIDVTESNDPPVVDTSDVTAAVTEAVTPVGNLTDSGTIGFSDVDTNDVHSIDGTITASPGALGSLTASVTTQTNSSGTGGVITWIYSVPAADVEFLAQGQTKVETFTITLDDGNSGRVARTITATITGTNDVPIVATTDLTGAVTELGTPAGNLTDSGTIGFSDVDVNDSHNIDSTITASPGALGNLTASVTTATSNGTGGVITWNYSVPAAALEFLAQGETKIETFTVTLDDDNGGTVDRTITMTITGENDAPVSEPPITASFNKEDASGTVDLLQNASDVDSTTLNVSSATVRANGADPGGITFDAANNRLVVNPDFYSDIEQTIDFVFDVTITDGIDSVNTTATVSIVAFPPTDITGTLFIDERNPARNSVFDSDEDGLTGIRVHLRSAAANNSTGQDIDLKTLSDAYGQYAFLGVPPGTYELEYDLPSQVVYVGSNTMTIVVNPSDGTPFPPLSFAALGLSGSLASLDIIASTYLNDHGQISHDSNGGLEGGSVKLRADGSQEMIVLADGFEGADFVEFVLNEDKTAGAITKVVDGIRSTAVVSGDHFVLAADGCSIRFFGGLDDFIFDDSVASEFPALGTAVDEYFENLGQL